MAKDNDYSRAMDLLMGSVDKPTHDPNFFKEKDAHSEIDTLINLNNLEKILSEYSDDDIWIIKIG